MRILDVQVWLALAALLAASFVAPAAAEECLTDWGAAGQIVRREKLLTVQQLTQEESVLLPGTPIKTTLCKVGDDYVYKVVVRVTGGALKTIVVDARRPDPAAAEREKSR